MWQICQAPLYLPARIVTGSHRDCPRQGNASCGVSSDVHSLQQGRYPCPRLVERRHLHRRTAAMFSVYHQRHLISLVEWLFKRAQLGKIVKHRCQAVQRACTGVSIVNSQQGGWALSVCKSTFINIGREHRCLRQLEEPWHTAEQSGQDQESSDTCANALRNGRHRP